MVYYVEYDYLKTLNSLILTKNRNLQSPTVSRYVGGPFYSLKNCKIFLNAAEKCAKTNTPQIYEWEE